MSGVSSTILATSVFLTALAGFGAGYLVSPQPARSGDSQPIIDPDAWNRHAPTPPVQAAVEPAKCAPPKISPEIPASAMQADADDIELRGWQSPEQAIPEDDAGLASPSEGYAVEPLDGSDSAGRGSSTIMVLNKAEADRAWNRLSNSAASEQSSDTAPASTSR